MLLIHSRTDKGEADYIYGKFFKFWVCFDGKSIEKVVKSTAHLAGGVGVVKMTSSYKYIKCDGRCMTSINSIVSVYVTLQNTDAPVEQLNI